MVTMLINVARRYKYAFILLAVLLLWLLLQPKRTVFYALEDLQFSWYSLALFPGSNFELHISSADYSGRYTVKGDTIFLAHHSPDAIKYKAPAAFLISRHNARIDELEVVNGKYEIAHGWNRSMNIVKNELSNN